MSDTQSPTKAQSPTGEHPDIAEEQFEEQHGIYWKPMFQGYIFI